MSNKRTPTKYPGVFYREARRLGGPGLERVYYVVFKRDGKVIEEKAGRQYTDDMTPARAAAFRAERIEGKRLSRAEIRKEEEAAKRAEANRWTLDRLWDEYAAQRPAGGAHATDEGRYRKHLSSSLGVKTPDEIVTLDVDRLKVKLLKDLAPQTVKHVLALLKRIIRYGVHAGLIDPPSPRRFTIKMPKFDNTKTETLSDEQLAALLNSAAEDENWKAGALVLLSLATGMRRGEMLSLRWQDVDMEAGFITLSRTKSVKVQRVPINPMARKVLESLPTQESGKLLFPGDNPGEPVRNVYPALRRIRRRAGLPDTVRPLHAWRHLFASRLATSGESLYVIQKLLRHADPRMTQRYSDLADEALRRGSNAASNLITEAAANGKACTKVVKLDDFKSS